MMIRPVPMPPAAPATPGNERSGQRENEIHPQPKHAGGLCAGRG
jgi:hypothetical protein